MTGRLSAERRGPGRRIVHSSVVGVAVAAVLCAAAIVAVLRVLDNGPTRLIAGPGDLGHIHDLVLTDDGTLMVAAHTGLYRITSPNEAVLVGEGRHDLMALTTTSEGELLASGHPDLRDPTWRTEGRPPHFGLVKSDSGGRTWQRLSLLGEADFHALAALPDGSIVAAESGGAVMRSDDGSEWATLSSLDAADLAFDPDDPTRMAATTYDQELVASGDGANSWDRAPSAPRLAVIDWPSPDLIIGASSDGDVWAAPGPVGPWNEISSLSREVEALLADGVGQLWIALDGGTILHSANGGSTFDPVYVPPE